MTKTNYNGSVNFHADRKIYSAPIIEESFIDDNGEVIHILSNGNQLSELNYLKHWGQPPKGKIITDKKYKGENPDRTKISY